MIKVSQPMVDGRADGALWLNFDNDTQTNLDCIYPASPYIFKEVEGCNDIWSFEMPWHKAKKCLWTVTNEEAYLVYRGRVIIHNQEWVYLNQWRIGRSVLRIKLRFQRLVTVETPEIGVTGKNVQKAAITKQLVALELGSPAIIELGTLVPWPFKIYTHEMLIHPSGKVDSWTYYNETCVSTFGQECRQYWGTSITLSPETCTLDGVYSYNFTLGCGEDSISNCSLDLDDPTEYKASVQFTLKSENFCAEILVDVGISGNVKSYEDQTFTAAQVKTSFIVNRRVYYLAQVNSDLNTPSDPDNYNHATAEVQFDFVEVLNVAVKFTNGTLLYVYENKVAVNYAAKGQADFKTLCQVHTDKLPGNVALGHNQVGFSFVLTRELAAPPKNQKTTIRVIADLRVTYLNTSKKRQATESDQSAFVLDNDVEDDGNGPVDTTLTTPTNTNTNTNTNVQPTKETTDSNAFSIFASLMMMFVALMI